MYKIVSFALTADPVRFTPREQAKYFQSIDELGLPFPFADSPTDYLDFVHVVWMGDSFFNQPDNLKHNVEAFRNRFRRKEILLWTDQGSIQDPAVRKWATENRIRLIPIDRVFGADEPMINQSVFDRESQIVETNQGKRSDVLRLEIIYRFGGAYVEPDNTLESLLHLDDIRALGTKPVFSRDRQFGNSWRYAKWKLGDDDRPEVPVWLSCTNDVLSANRPGLPQVRALIDELGRRAGLTYRELKSLAVTRTVPSRTRDWEFKYPFWSTLVVSGPKLYNRALFNDRVIVPREDRIAVPVSETAFSWMPKIEQRYADWWPQTESDSDQMMDRIIESTLSRLKRHRLDLTRYDFLIDRCIATEVYPDPQKAVIDAVQNALHNSQGDIQIKYVFAHSEDEYRKCWAMVDSTGNSGISKESMRSGRETPNLFKPLKRAIKQRNQLLAYYFMRQWTDDMWLIESERRGKIVPFEFTRAFRLIRTSDASSKDMTRLVNGFIVNSLNEIKGKMGSSIEFKSIARSIAHGFQGFYKAKQSDPPASKCAPVVAEDESLGRPQPVVVGPVSHRFT